MFYNLQGSAMTKLGEVENEYTLHNFIALAIYVPKIIEVS